MFCSLFKTGDPFTVIVTRKGNLGSMQLYFPEYATQAFEITMAQETTKRQEISAQAKILEAQIEESKNQQIRTQHEERRKTLKVNGKFRSRLPTLSGIVKGSGNFPTCR